MGAMPSLGRTEPGRDQQQGTSGQHEDGRHHAATLSCAPLDVGKIQAGGDHGVHQKQDTPPSDSTPWTGSSIPVTAG